MSVAEEHYRAGGHKYVEDDQCGEESVAESDPLFEIHNCHRGPRPIGKRPSLKVSWYSSLIVYSKKMGHLEQRVRERSQNMKGSYLD